MNKFNKPEIVERVSVGFTQAEWDLLEEALRVRYREPNTANLSAQERTSFIRNALWAIASAVVRDGFLVGFPAADIRQETDEERAARLEKRYGKKPDDAHRGSAGPFNRWN